MTKIIYTQSSAFNHILNMSGFLITQKLSKPAERILYLLIKTAGCGWKLSDKLVRVKNILLTCYFHGQEWAFVIKTQVVK